MSKYQALKDPVEKSKSFIAIEVPALQDSTLLHSTKAKSKLKHRSASSIFNDEALTQPDHPAHDAILMHQRNSFERAKCRITSLMLTLCVELFVAFVVSSFSTILEDYPLLAAFMPVISAVGGNVGLQSSSILVRELAIGILPRKEYKKAVYREAKTAFYLGVMCGIIVSLIAGIWQASALFGFVVGISQFFSILTAAITGSMAPLISVSLGIDPAAFAGPLETALQDVVGNGLFLGLATLLLEVLR